MNYGKHKLPKLPYPYNALEPIISEKLLHLHHDVHHKKYVEELNKTERLLAMALDKGNYSILKMIEENLAFNASGHILHSIYWTNMDPNNRHITPLFDKVIDDNFHNVETLKELMKQAALSVEGSGWAILGWNIAFKRLDVVMVEKHQNNDIAGIIPILVLDIWEHAFYLDYLADKTKFIEQWWTLINWKDVEERYFNALEGQLLLDDKTSI